MIKVVQCGFFLEVFMQVFVRAEAFGSVCRGFLIDAVLVFLETGSLPDLGFFQAG